MTVEVPYCERVICPECKGTKVMLYPVLPYDEREELPCNTCGGEGMVEKIIIYKRI